VRNHLRLVGTPIERSSADARPLLYARALATALALALFTWLSLLAAALALVPVAWRRGPLGVRLRPIRPREARVIPFQPRRQALPR
jgi:hypothetical protein